MANRQTVEPNPDGSFTDQAPPDDDAKISSDELVQELKDALEEANTKIEELRNAHEVLKAENVELMEKLTAPRPEAAMPNSEVENLKRELYEAKNTFKGILRFLHDPTNSQNEKLALLQRELAKP